MRYLSTLTIDITNKIWAILIVCILNYIVGIFLFKYSFAGSILVALAVLIFGLLLLYPKLFIYFFLCFTPLMPLLVKFGKINLEGGYHSEVGLGGIILVVGFLFSAFYIVTRKVRIFDRRLAVPIIIFLSIMLFGCLYAPYKVLALRHWISYAVPMMLYFMILEEFNSIKDAKKLLHLAYFFFLLPIIVAYFQWMTMYGYVPGQAGSVDLGKELVVHRISSIVNVNIFGIQLMFFSCLSIFLFMEMRTKWFYLLCFISMQPLIFSTYSRVTWISYTIAIIIIGFARHRKFVALFLAFIVLLMLMMPFVPRYISLRMESDASSRLRMGLVGFGLGKFREKPILGYGTASFNDLYGKYLRPIKVGKLLPDERPALSERSGKSPHNEYLKMIVEGGIVLITAYLFLMYKLITFAWKLFRFVCSATLVNYGVFLLGLTGSIIVYALSGEALLSVGVYLWGAVAIGEIYLRQSQIKSFDDNKLAA